MLVRLRQPLHPFICDSTDLNCFLHLQGHCGLEEKLIQFQLVKSWKQLQPRACTLHLGGDELGNGFGNVLEGCELTRHT